MNQHDLLTALDELLAEEIAAGREGQRRATLIREAAAEIRRLSPLKSAPLTDEETAAVLDVFGRTDTEAEAGL